MDATIMASWNTQAAKLSLMGTTIVASSGDNGKNLPPSLLLFLYLPHYLGRDTHAFNLKTMIPYHQS